MSKDFNIIVFISGRGSNLAGLIKGQLNYNIQAVICNNATAPGLNYARDNNIPFFCFERKDYQNLKAMKAAIRQKVSQLKPKLIALAGYMQLIEPEMIELFPGKIVNIHPALLPNYKGLDTHKRVLADSANEHGCTVHQVDSGIDTGQIIAKAKLQVQTNETEELLAARVLKLEHSLYPWIINEIAVGNIKLSIKEQPSYNAEAIEAAKNFNFLLFGDS